MTIVRRKSRRIRRSALTLEACEARILMATAPPMGAAASFAVLGGTTVTSTGATQIVGDVGVSPGTSITGFGPGVISGGGLQSDNATSTQAEADLSTAYNDLAAEPVDTILSGRDLGGQTLTPGVYHFGTTASLNGALTLDAQGDPSAIFVIQIGTALTTGTNSSVALINGAHARNVFWQVGSSATIGTDTAFQGSILAYTSISLDTGAAVSPGRALAINGAVTMVDNAISAVFTTPLTVIPDPQTSVYGDALPHLTASYSGFIDGDTSASLTTQPTLTTTATSASHVGSYDIDASGAADPYYTISYDTGTLTVTPATLTFTPDDLTKLYGAPLPTLTATYSGLVNGDTLTTPPTLSTAATSASHVGSYDIDAGGAAADTDYTISYNTGTLTVTPATLTITPNDSTKVYGAALPTLTATYSGLVNGDTSATLTIPPTLTTVATSASHVGSYDIDAAGAADPDYTISYGTGTLRVTPATLTITPDDLTKLYGAPLPTLTATYSGLVNGDTPNTLTIPPTLMTSATAASPAGSYSIIAGGAADPDYTISYGTGSLTVTPEPTTSGTVYLDLNANGSLDAGEPGLPGRVVFLDLNRDGTLDPGDPTDTTDANGHFALTGEAAGSFPVLEATGQDASSRYVVDQLQLVEGGANIGVVPFSPIAPVPVIPNPFTGVTPTDPNSAYVQSLYHAVLGRVGAPGEVTFWVGGLQGGLTPQAVAMDFVESLEHRQDQVDAYYEEILHRAPDPYSAYWVGNLMAGASEEVVVEGILDSAEYQSAHQDPGLFVADLYLDVLGRQGTPSEISFWQAGLAQGLDRQTVVADFVTSAEAVDQVVESFYTAFLHRPREPVTSDIWVNILETPNGSATDVAAGILSSPEFDRDAANTGT